MKTCKHLLSVLALIAIVTLQLNAQVEVVTNGNVKLGNPRPGDDYNNETTVNSFGLGTDTYRVGSRISFGDYGASANYGANVFLGEYRGTSTNQSTWDTDALQLHGKNGIWFTTQGQGAFAAMKLESTGALLVASTVTQNASISSNIRLKSNIRGIDNSMELIRQLSGIKYDFNPKLVSAEQIAALDQARPTNEKERAALEKARAELTQLSQPIKDQYGFSAQAVKEIMPELVTETSDGYLAVNYIAIVPILVEALKAQQAQIETLQQELANIKTNCCRE